MTLPMPLKLLALRGGAAIVTIIHEYAYNTYKGGLNRCLAKSGRRQALWRS